MSLSYTLRNRARTHNVFKSALESDMSLREVWINGVSEDHEVDATLIWTKTDVDRNSRVGLFQVNSSKCKFLSARFDFFSRGGEYCRKC